MLVLKIVKKLCPLRLLVNVILIERNIEVEFLEVYVPDGVRFNKLVPYGVVIHLVEQRTQITDPFCRILAVHRKDLEEIEKILGGKLFDRLLDELCSREELTPVAPVLLDGLRRDLVTVSPVHHEIRVDILQRRTGFTVIEGVQILDQAVLRCRNDLPAFTIVSNI